MKHILAYISILALSALLSCSLDPASIAVDDDNEGLVPVSILAGKADCFTATRTSISGTTLSWTDSDRIGLFAAGLQSNRPLSHHDGNEFTGSFLPRKERRDEAEYYAYAPYTSSADGYRISGSLSRTQTAPFDSRYDYMVAGVVKAPYDEEQMPELGFTFENHLFAIVKLTVTNTDERLKDEKLSSVVLKAPNGLLAGEFRFDVSKGAFARPLFYGDVYDSVTLSYPSSEVPALGLNEKHELHAVVMPSVCRGISVTVNTKGYQGEITSDYVISFANGYITDLPQIDFAAIAQQRPHEYDYECSFMGDSITSVWGSTDGTYFSDNNYLNKGISGQTTTQMLARFNNDIVKKDPRLVAIMAGTNDIAQNQGYISNDGIMANLAAMAEMASAAKIKVLLCTVLPVKKYGWRPTLKDPDGNILDPMTVIQDLNGKIKSYCIAHPDYCTFVDYYADWVNDDNTGPKDGVTYDGVHPSLAGCKVLESVIQPIIEATD